MQRLKAVRELLGAVLANPDVLDEYVRYRLLVALEADGVYVEPLSELTSISREEEEILAPVLSELSDEATRHFREARIEEDPFEALMPLSEAFAEKLVGARLEEVGA